MKLSKAQVKALEAVEDGKVSIYKPMRMNKPQKLCGMHNSTYKILIACGFVVSRYADISSNMVQLTPAGRQALEEARNG